MTAWQAWLGDRRAVALQAAMLVAAGVVWMAPDFGSWRGSWKQALDLGAGATTLIGPVVAGAACVAYARLRRSAMSELLLQGGRGRLAWLRPGLVLWAMAAVALLVVTLTATTLASWSGVPSYWASAWILVPSLVVLGAQAALGSAIGFSTGRSWLAPFAVVLVFSLSMLTAVGLFPQVFSTGGATGSLSSQRFVVWPVLSPGVAAAGIAVCLVAASHRRLFLSTWPWRALVTAAAAAAVVGWFLAPADSDARYRTVADPPLTCAGSQPQVCLFAETPRPLADLSARMHRQARALVRLGVPMPERFAQSYPGGERPGDGDVVLRDRQSQSTVSDDLATSSLVKPSSSCPGDSGSEPPYLAFEARHLLGRWLQVQAGLLTPKADDSDRSWLTGGGADQETWVRTTYRQLTDCAFDQIVMPGGLD